MIKTGVLSVNSLIVPIILPEGSNSSGGKQGFVVDPADCSLSRDDGKIVDYLKKNKIECVGIILTHSHFDHILGIKSLKSAFPNAKIYIHKDEKNELGFVCGPMNNSVLHLFAAEHIIEEVEKQPPADVLLNDGDEVFGWKVIHTPGHSPGSICLYNKAENILISGDTLFDYNGYGRTDMYGGDESVIIKSLGMLKRIIPKETIVYPGHDTFGFKF